MGNKLILGLLLCFMHCSKGPLKKSDDVNRLKVTYFISTNVQKTSVELHWGCSSEAEGYLMYGKEGIENLQYLWLPSKQHFYNVTGLTLGNTYKAAAFCGNIDTSATTYFQNFYTLSGIAEDIKQRGIWILGGMSYSNGPVAQVDLYDPVENKWYEKVSEIPTPRTYSAITSYRSKIYIFGGIVDDTPVNTVEEFDPSTETWKTLETMPVALQGSMAVAGEDAIYILGGSISTSVTSAIPDVVFRFIPEKGDLGTWKILSASNISARVDYSGCSTGGTVYFNSGRASDGSAQLVSDAYVVSGNTTTTTTEASFGIASFGAAAACYRPRPLGPNTEDSPAMFVIGGSSLADKDQPPGAVQSINRVEYYLTPSDTGSNTVNTAPNLPVALYYPATEVSYENRKIYVFGGANVV
ncbi:MAG: hypothetical protein KDK90_25880, partial [Leptospiraceae bacterium]|nr:hypothetical protein [Leptospiraceae bacterium]